MQRRASVWLGLSWLLATRAVAAQDCAPSEVALPVPEYREGVRLWPPGLRPADPPGVRLPAERDSTSYRSTTFPSASSGHELFWHVTASGGALFVAYNMGLQAWTPNADGRPRLRAARDGLRAGDWLVRQVSGEADGFINDIAALDPEPDGTIRVAVSASSSVGPTVWRYTASSGGLDAVYQDNTTGTSAAVLLRDAGRRWLFGLEDGTRGMYAWDVTSDAPCADTETGSVCSARRSLVRGTEGMRGYLRALSYDGGLYLATASGGVTASSPPLRIVRLQHDASGWSVTERYRHPAGQIDAPLLWVSGSEAYLSAVVGGRSLATWRVGACLRGGECRALVEAHARIEGLRVASRHRLTFSRGVISALYHGVSGSASTGPAAEHLWNVDGIADGRVVNLLDGGGTYRDACTNTTVDYWSDLYERNTYGLRNVLGSEAVLQGRFLYRAATGVFDVHEVLVGASPTDAGVAPLDVSRADVSGLDVAADDRGPSLDTNRADRTSADVLLDRASPVDSLPSDDLAAATDATAPTDVLSALDASADVARADAPAIVEEPVEPPFEAAPQGCACRASHRSSGGRWGALLALGIALARRRRRSWMLPVVMLGCSPSLELDETSVPMARDAAMDVFRTDLAPLDAPVREVSALDASVRDVSTPDVFTTDRALDASRPDLVTVDLPPLSEREMVDMAAPPDLGADVAPEAGSGCSELNLGDFTATESDSFRAIELPMEPESVYRSFSASFDVTPSAAWPETCWNPVGSGEVMGPFQLLLELRKGERFCRGGNLLELTTRAPPQQDVWGSSYWAERVGSSCGGDEHRLWTRTPRHSLTPGVRAAVTVAFDAVAHSVSVRLGDTTLTGPSDPRVVLARRGADALFLVLGNERDQECFNPPGDTTPDPPCCHRRSVGWRWEHLRVTLCR